MHEPEPGATRRIVIRAVRDRPTRDAAGTIAERPEPVRRDRLQDQRRPRQLQRDAAVADPALGERPVAERAVHARQAATATPAGRTKRTPPATTRGRSADFDYDNGYNNFDVRHTFNLSVLYRFRTAADAAAARRATRLGGWDVGGIVNARSGLPVQRPRSRAPTSSTSTRAGNVFTNPAAGRTAVINTPGGGASRNVRRPDLVPGVDPFIQNGGLLFLNPAAFATPAPGTFGNLERNSIHGPNFQQVDLVVVEAHRRSAGAATSSSGSRSSTCSTPRTSRTRSARCRMALPASSTDGSEQAAAGTAVHRGRGRHVRTDHLDGDQDGRPRHAAAGAVRAAAELLRPFRA